MTDRLKCYYAHCQALYNTPQETRDIELLNNLGFEVINPNAPEIQERAKKEGMACFEQIVKENQILAFRALPDLAIPAGVALELGWAREAEMLIFELPSSILRRSIGHLETVEYLREVGQR
jgi:hypothetical protein